MISMSRLLKTELVDLDVVLGNLELSREQFIDLAILVGTDFNTGVRGIGPKKGLKTIKRYGSIESLPPEIAAQVVGYGDVGEYF